jgi:aminoglycoside 3-N-acetyltransferase
MNEEIAVGLTSEPRTRQSLKSDLIQIGVTPGMVLLVHSSLSQIGWVNGAAVAVLQALMDVLTPRGTLVMPTHSTDYSDPAGWQNPPIPHEWHQQVRQTMPAYDPRLTPTRDMGRIPELFRTWPDVHRSDHPQVSFASWGRQAQRITSDHSLTNSLGPESPLARLYELEGYVLLLGVGYDRNTSFHLAEYRLPSSQPLISAAPLFENGRRVWKRFADIEFNDHLFPQIGAAMEMERPVHLGQIGSARSRLFSQPMAVDFAVHWLRAYGLQ